MTYLTSSLGESSLLGTVAAIPLYAAIFILFIDSKNLEHMKKVALGASMFTFVLSLGLWVLFDRSTAVFQFREYWQWLDQVNINFNLGVDGISLFFVILTTLLVPLCLLASWDSIKIHVKEYLIAFLVMETLLIIVFSIMDLLLFYVFFESVLIPMFLIVGIWGSRERKIRAAYLLFLYTLVGSVLMLLAILLIYSIAGTTTYTNLLTVQFDESLQKFLWLAFFASFAVKVPMVPVHIWLPEAHVEAPTAGSVILAGVLLKLGSYGLIRFSMPLFPAATIYFTPLVYTMAAIAVIYTSLTAIRQSDMKRIIAYASVAHMNVILVGMFALNMQGLEGAMIQMLSHGLVSSALFLCVGVLYDRHHSRMVKYYSGMAHTMPLFAIVFMFMTMANIALPGTSSFVGEFLILAGAFQVNTTICVLAGTGMILGGGYSLWLYNRIAFGNLKVQAIKQFSDMNRREFMVFLPLTVGTLVMGIYPEIFLDPMHVSIAGLIEHINCQVK
jgi:proton-translocating NADH-quinone oxidoreductase chain M|tara:strand:+ start:1538 stop:3037 length:1500 start_codon:yes stop_codon:yes gene_type:complete